jgi:photosystem II stability/assembly factor-like uncharacterized protein
MTFSNNRRGLAAGVVLACGLLSACSDSSVDMSGIAAERARPVQRYDTVQSVASNDKVVVAGTQSGVVLTSDDLGKSWQRITLGGSSLVDVAKCGDQGFVAVDHYHKVWFADAAGKQWQSVALEMPRTPLAVTCDPQGGWWVAGTNSVIAGSKDQGKTWTVTDLGKDAQITTIQFVDAQHGFALGEFGLTLSTEDGGMTWKFGPKIPDDFYAYAALFKDTKEGWVSGIAGQILHTVDGGKSWKKQTNATQAALKRLFMHDGMPFGVGAVGVIARLEGDTWRAVPYTDAAPITLMGGAPLPGQSALVIGGAGGLLRAVSTANKQ